MAIDVQALLGQEARDLLEHRCTTVPAEQLHLPSPRYVDKVMSATDRSPMVMRNFQALLNSGRLGGTGYVSILPVDQGVEHSAASAFAVNPIYFDPENIVRLALEAQCNAVASTLGVLGGVSRKYAHRIPFIVKLNHNELLSFPAMYRQTPFASVKQAFTMGAAGVGATVYFGSQESREQIRQVSEAFQHAHELGMFTVLWCYLRNNAFKTNQQDYQRAADLTGQGNHLGVTIEADLIKQKLPLVNDGYRVLGFGRTSPRVYEQLSSDHPIDMARYQVINCYMGRVGLVNSGGSSGKNDLADAVRTAVINKRAGGMGMIVGRKSFQKPMAEGIDLLNAVQDVYLDGSIGPA
ncbi:MAG: class I fructose-bisphosphate aldolase [Chitinivibrionales bacterium]|nr:class I fructose-bisphosphate aldolase [Chitinivibrionales bacterium]MBD3355714.1 class I fructose-bisphosphate aldolase [Chitinivibrionales bacterium]